MRTPFDGFRNEGKNIAAYFVQNLSSDAQIILLHVLLCTLIVYCNAGGLRSVELSFAFSVSLSWTMSFLSLSLPLSFSSSFSLSLSPTCLFFRLLCGPVRAFFSVGFSFFIPFFSSLYISVLFPNFSFFVLVLLVLFQFFRVYIITVFFMYFFFVLAQQRVYILRLGGDIPVCLCMPLS